MVASETCAFDLIDAKYVRDVEPGEMLVIDRDGLHSSFPLAEAEARALHLRARLFFAARFDQSSASRSTRAVTRWASSLRVEQPADADIVVPVPDSGVAAAIGYAAESGLKFRLGLVRNHYVGRTFIEPKQSIRNFGVRIKLNPVRDLIEGCARRVD